MSQTSLNSMKLKLWRRYMSVSAPRMTIRSQMSWPMRVSGIVLVGLAGAAVMWAIENRHLFDANTPESLQVQLAESRSRLNEIKLERDQLSATVNAAESQLNMERAAQNQLVAQVRVLEKENAQLKEDLAFFDSLLPNATGPQGIAIRRLKIDQFAPNQIRYRLLIMQGGAGGRNFAGNLQISVNAVQGGKNAMIHFPTESPAEQEKFKLNFRHYQRVEGILILPDGAVTRQVQARVVERGQVRAQASTSL